MPLNEPKLYLLRLGSTDIYKIGISCRPCVRLSQLKGKRESIEIVAVWPGLAHMERTLHRQYSHKRLKGADVPDSGATEWFRLTAEEVKAIRTDCALARMKEESRCQL